jgi:hypothetical protein
LRAAASDGGDGGDGFTHPRKKRVALTHAPPAVFRTLYVVRLAKVFSGLRLNVATKATIVTAKSRRFVAALTANVDRQR